MADKNGITQAALAKWFGVGRKSTLNGPTRPEEHDLIDANRDKQRARHLRKLSDERLNDLKEVFSRVETLGRTAV